MKSVVACAIVLLMFAAATQAKEYQSSFGFTLDIPDNWLVLTKQAIQDNPALVDPDDAKVGDINPNLLKDLKAKVESGSIEMFFDRTTSDATFADNINVIVRPGQVPDKPEQVQAVCGAYPGQLAKYVGRSLAVARCETREVGAMKTLYVEWEGVVAGTVSMQYRIQRPDNKVLFLTATCKQSSADKVRPDFEAIVKSIKFS